jgi:CheY-like chemotaxis protein
MACTVVIVEDADICSTVLEIALVGMPGISIKSAASAEEALEYLDRRDICALITDLHLPHMDGFELIERVRNRPNHPRLPIVVISGDTDPRTPERVQRLGADAFFTKPYSPGEVRQKLEQLIHGT